MIPASIAKLRWPILVYLVVLALLELYLRLAEFFDFVIGESAGTSGGPGSCLARFYSFPPFLSDRYLPSSARE
jgi:hypothetical protein